MIVLKFGGTSIGNAGAIGNVIQIIKKSAKEPIILVFSAFGNTTDNLLNAAELAVSGELEGSKKTLQKTEEYHFELAQKFIAQNEFLDLQKKLNLYFEKLSGMVTGIAALRDFSSAVKDEFLAHGELLSTTILDVILRKFNLPTVWIDSRSLIKTDSKFTQAEPDFSKSSEQVHKILPPILEAGQIPVVAGFIAGNSEGRTTTLGRGGSDYTAAILGSLLNVREVKIWTDVDGIMTADPSVVPEARSIRSMSFQEAAELAYFGARVLHPKTITPAMEKKIPVRVLNTHRPEGGGTLILPFSKLNGNPVKSIAYKEGMTLINVVLSKFFKAYGFLRQISEVFNTYKTSVDLIATTEVSVAIAIHEFPNRKEVLQDLKAFGKVAYQKNQAVVCVVGEQIRQQPGIAGRIFTAIPETPISMISQGGSEINISFVCHEKHLDYVIKNLHHTFFEDSCLEKNKFPAIETLSLQN